jgi:periplasmic divalent cation tolerance protein
MFDSHYRVVLSSAPTLEAARYLAETLVKENLAACINLIPGVESIYHWQGELCHGKEVYLLMKSDAARLPALEQRLRALHPYQVPAFVALPAAHVSDNYAQWLHDALKGG